MQARTRMGLIVGAIGLVLNICVAGFLGICGPVVSLIAGGVAGYLAAQREQPFTKNEGARVGATAGGIAGALIIIGQLIGGVVSLAILQAAGMETVFGQLPTDPGSQVGVYAGGIGGALCIGIVGALLAAGAGAGAGYLATPDRPTMPPGSPDNIITP